MTAASALERLEEVEIPPVELLLNLDHPTPSP